VRLYNAVRTIIAFAAALTAVDWIMLICGCGSIVDAPAIPLYGHCLDPLTFVALLYLMKRWWKTPDEGLITTDGYVVWLVFSCVVGIAATFVAGGLCGAIVTAVLIAFLIAILIVGALMVVICYGIPSLLIRRIKLEVDRHRSVESAHTR
jgi:hypothetical protein